MNKEELEKIAEGSGEGSIDAALESIKSSDRNQRVLALRTLGRANGDEGAVGILEGLRDSKRRVREVAIKCSRPYLDQPAIVERLKEIVEDEGEKSRIRSQALHALGGHYPHGPTPHYVPEAAIRALQTMATAEKYRAGVLWRLLQMDLTPEIEDLLRQFVKEGTREEAVMATRALCGFRVVNIGVFDEPERRRIAQTMELAAGRVFYWVKREQSREAR